MGNSNHIFESLFKTKLSSEDVTGYLEEIAIEYPYFSPVQFFLLQQQQTNTPAYKLQAAKTSVLFNNAHWLNFQLLENEDGLAQLRNVELSAEAKNEDDFLITEVNENDEKNYEETPKPTTEAIVHINEFVDRPGETTAAINDENNSVASINNENDSEAEEIAVEENAASSSLISEEGIEPAAENIIGEDPNPNIEEDPISSSTENKSVQLEEDIAAASELPINQTEEPTVEVESTENKNESIQVEEDIDGASELPIDQTEESTVEVESTENHNVNIQIEEDIDGASELSIDQTEEPTVEIESTENKNESIRVDEDIAATSELPTDQTEDIAAITEQSIDQAEPSSKGDSSQASEQEIKKEEPVNAEDAQEFSTTELEPGPNNNEAPISNTPLTEELSTNSSDADEELPLTEDDIDPADNKPLNFKLNIEPPSTTEKEITFEPLHTTDYFASLGIKLSNEIKAGDKLGKQLKSFTDWLKTMKKIHTDKLEQSSGQADQVIQSLAEKSNTEGEVLTETMAEVLIQQGKADKAIDVYKKLSLLNPSKNAYFAAKIDQLKQ